MSAVVVQVQNKEDKWVVGGKLYLLFCRENKILQTNLVWFLEYSPIFAWSLWRTLDFNCHLFFLSYERQLGMYLFSKSAVFLTLLKKGGGVKPM